MSLRVSAQPTAAGTELYEDVLAEAMRAYQAHDWARACERFERAFALYPNARALRGLGVSAFESGQHVRAVRALAGALAHTEKPLSPDLRELTQLLLEKARAKVATYRIARSPEGARVMVDGAEAAFEPDGTLLLDAGPHALRVEAEGHASEARDLLVTEGEQATLQVTLAPLEPTPEALATPVVPPVVTEPVRPPPVVLAPTARTKALTDGTSSPPPRWQRITLWTSVGVTGAAAVSAGLLWWTGRERIDDLTTHCNAMPNGCAESDARRRLHDAHLPRLERGINASMGIAAGAAVTAAVMWTLSLWRPKKRAKQLALRVAF